MGEEEGYEEEIPVDDPDLPDPVVSGGTYDFSTHEYWKETSDGWIPVNETEVQGPWAYVTNEWIMEHLDEILIFQIDDPAAEGYWEEGPNGYVPTEDTEQIPGKRYYATVPPEGVDPLYRIYEEELQMAVYLPEFDGYIVDNPIMLFERCDGRRFYYDELDSCSVTQSSELITINGGQSNYPLAQIDTSKTFEIQAASAQFKLDLFELANATDHTEGDIGALGGGRYTVDANLKLTLPFEVKANSVAIAGFEEVATTPAAGKFAVTITPSAAATAGKTEITFYTGDVAVGDDVFVTYTKRIVAAKMVDIKSNSTTAKGSLQLYWPVYSSGQDCSEASEKGQLGLKVYRVRVTALPGFSNSYKSAA